MLTKHSRATTKVVEQIFQKGRFVNSPNLTLKYIFNPDSKTVQVSCVAPKTVAKNAVKRNLLRRRGYRALEKYMKNFPAGIQAALVFGKNGLSVFGGSKTSTHDPITTLQKEIEIILHKIN